MKTMDRIAQALFGSRARIAQAQKDALRKRQEVLASLDAIDEECDRAIERLRREGREAVEIRVESARQSSARPPSLLDVEEATPT